jgi:hypothetical protein
MPSLNIKNDEAYRLIRELADREGKSMTTVVIEAVREKLERESAASEERIQYWLKVGQEIRDKADPEWLARDQIEDLYDDQLGLPK